MTRYATVVYTGAGLLIAALLPAAAHIPAALWLVTGIAFLSRRGITPPDYPADTLRFWVDHARMALLWPLLAYWVLRRGARVPVRCDLMHGRDGRSR